MMSALVIGCGPAGLMAAHVMAQAGMSVTVYEAKPSVARKFLMAGKSGLNLTKDEPLSDFLPHFTDVDAQFIQILHSFGPSEVQAFARDLRQDIFTGSTGRVFPKAMKASPLLRAWMARLAELNVEIHTRHRWVGCDNDTFLFDTLEGTVGVKADVVVLATGGGSWARLGSDGAWVPHLRDWGVSVAPFKPMNMGFAKNWSDHMKPSFGQPIKNIALTAANRRVRGEFVIANDGVEGGAIYAVSDLVRDGAVPVIDFLPDLTMDQIQQKLFKGRKGDSVASILKRQFNVVGAKRALFFELTRGASESLSSLLKHCPFPLDAPRPIDQAISTAGGVEFDALDNGLMLKARPGVFCAGEMLDWSAPTGGYLLTACFATGAWAGQAAARYANTL